VVHQRAGERVRTFLAQAGWGEREQAIAAALKARRRVHVTVRSAAAELYLLPWELLTLKATGQNLGELPGCLIRYEWPSTETAWARPDPPPEGGRILFAWSGAGGAVPSAEQIAALRRACAEGRHPFDAERDVLANVSLERLNDALAAPGAPVSVLHLLCHGGRLDTKGEAYGLVWNGGAGDKPVLVDARSLARVLERHPGTLRLVVLSACFGGHGSAPGTALGSIAQELHRLGIPAVIASRQPLSVPGSITLTETLYRRLLVDLGSLEDTFLAARDQLALDASSGDWASVQLYARAADGPDHRPFVVRPYRGLDPFTADDRRFFFGRSADVDKLVARLSPDARLLVLVGASGSGKSSLAMAGLVPALLGGPRALRAMVVRPGARPCHALAAALGGDVEAALRGRPEALAELAEQRFSAQPGDPRLLVVADQIEELFTQAEDRAEAAAFVANLLHASEAPGGRVYVVLTLRADFLGRCLAFDRALAERVKASMEVVLPMSEEAMREAVTRPAGMVGLRFEDGLVEALLGALREGPAAGDLPLLSFALEALWARRRGSAIPWAAWEAIGGVEGAITRRADEVLAGCASDADRTLVRDLFRRLVSLGQGTEDTRRYASRAELASLAPGRAEAELLRWIASRLLTADEEHVWVAHEAVIRSWTTLRRWIDEDREARLVEQDIGQAAHRWEADGRSADELWRGGRLRRAMELREAGRLVLAGGEAAFLEAAEEARRAEDAAEEARQRAELRRARKLAAVAIAVTMVVAVIGGVAWLQRGAARRAEQTASEKADEARIAEKKATDKAKEARTASILTGVREMLALHKLDTAALLLLEVDEPEHTRGWRSLAFETLTAGFPSVPASDAPQAGLATERAAALPKGAKVLEITDDGVVEARNADGSGAPTKVGEHRGEALMVRLSPDGRRLAAAFEGSHDKAAAPSDDKKIVWVWSADAPGRALRLVHDDEVGFLEWSPDGTRLLTFAEYDRTVWVWSAGGRGKPVRLHGHDDYVKVAAWSPDGKRVLTGGMDNTMRVWNADGSGAPLVLRGHEQWVRDLAWSPDGKRVLSCDGKGVTRVWRSDGPSTPLVLYDVCAGAFSSDGERVARRRGAAREWRIDTPRQPLLLRGHTNIVFDVAWSPDGKRVATASGDDTARIWSADGAGAPVVLRGHKKQLGGVGWSPDGKRVLTTSWDGTARVWSADGAETPLVLRGYEGPTRFATWSPDGKRVATSSVGPECTGKSTECKTKALLVWNADSMGAPIVLRGHEDYITSAAWSPDGKRIVTTSSDGTARLWNADGSGDPRVFRTTGGDYGKIFAAAWSPDGKNLLVSSMSTTQVWSAEGTGTPVVLDAELGFYRAAFSPDGKRVLLSDAAEVWNIDGSGPPVKLAHEGGLVAAATFSADGTQVLTVRKPGIVRIQNADGTGEPTVLLGYEGELGDASSDPEGVWLQAAISPDGARVLAVEKRWNVSPVVRVWSIAHPLLVDALRGATDACLQARERVTYLLDPEPEARTKFDRCQRDHGRTP
jgi:WD40 repeat protein